MPGNNESLTVRKHFIHQAPFHERRQTRSSFDHERSTIQRLVPQLEKRLSCLVERPWRAFGTTRNGCDVFLNQSSPRLPGSRPKLHVEEIAEELEVALRNLRGSDRSKSLPCRHHPTRETLKFGEAKELFESIPDTAAHAIISALSTRNIESEGRSVHVVLTRPLRKERRDATHSGNIQFDRVATHRNGGRNLLAAESQGHQLLFNRPTLSKGRIGTIHDVSQV